MAKKKNQKKTLKVNDLRPEKDPKGGDLSLNYTKIQYQYSTTDPATADAPATTTTLKK